MTDNSADDVAAAKVGYGNPPLHSRFKPGQSGNPKGRPRGKRNLAGEIERAMAMPVPVTINGKRKKVSTITALVWRLREKALGGDLKALQMLLALQTDYLGDDKAAGSLSMLLAEDAAILRDAGLAKGVEQSDGCA